MQTMKANRVHRFGPPEVIVFEEVERPVPGEGEVLVRVKAAGVGPWDAWVRAGKSVLPQPLPLTLGSDLSGIVESVGPGDCPFAPGDDVFGVTNKRFTGAYAEYAVALTGMIARKPRTLGDVEAASVPVVAVTAWQMLFEYARVAPGQRVLVQGGGGNVGAYAVQLARNAGAHVVATTMADDVEYVQGLGASEVIDVSKTRFEEVMAAPVDAVIDTVGGDTLRRSFAVLKPGGVLVSSVAAPDPEEAARRQVSASFLLVDVTSEQLARIASMFDAGALRTCVGEVLPLAAARIAHDMLEGMRPRPRGKIVLAANASIEPQVSRSW
jgi:NADPH:quinone reductase-like Zn-dependent oxidoreductase